MLLLLCVVARPPQGSSKCPSSTPGSPTVPLSRYATNAPPANSAPSAQPHRSPRKMPKAAKTELTKLARNYVPR
jgi:hypothetical protein